MLAITSRRFDRDYKKLDPLLKHRVNKAIDILVGDPTRPSLRIKRLKGADETWSCRVTKSVRIIYRLLDSNRIQLLLVGPHDAAYRAGVFYWLAASGVEEEIPASELQSLQMFTSSMNGIEGHLNELGQLSSHLNHGRRGHRWKGSDTRSARYQRSDQRDSKRARG
jgi:mRNA-degrading endonuclease RelE of RelBE toxin-antitoxin system